MPACRGPAIGPGGVRLGYGGGFYDRTLASLSPLPFTAGIGYAHGYIPWLEAEPHDVPMTHALTPGSGLVKLGV